jgi:hypothetical protein
MKAKIIALLAGLLIMAGCVSAGIGVGGHGAGAYVHPLGGGVYVE